MPIEINHERPRLPDPELIEQPEVKAAVEEWRRASETARQAWQDLAALEQELPAAEALDREAFAAALEKDPAANDPGVKHTKTHREKIADAGRRADAVELVEQRAKAKMIEVIAENSTEWAELAEKNLQAIQVEWLEAIGVLNAKHSELSQAASVAAFTRSGRLKHGANTVQVRRDGIGVDELLTALRSLGERPAETQPAVLHAA